jgi:hypothetical protein
MLVAVPPIQILHIRSFVLHVLNTLRLWPPERASGQPRNCDESLGLRPFTMHGVTVTHGEEGL